MAADVARTLNQSIPFAQDRGPAARPFAAAGPPESRARATDCLASAMWYEAGEDARGQQAVAQVVLNRVRHPAYPATVCAVVFQGSQRRTGCQFTFTCDGALRRRPSAASLERARQRARAMLEGAVHAEVGLATHYHTDWVRPIWSGELDKIAQVDTHLFFRWNGFWGGPAAHRRTYRGGEPVVAALAPLSVHHASAGADPLVAAPVSSLETGATASQSPSPADLGGGRFRIVFSPTRSANVQAAAALELCGDRATCKLTGVLEGVDDRDGAVVFVYLRDGPAERALWNCAVFPRLTPAQCLDEERDIVSVRAAAAGAGLGGGATPASGVRADGR